MRTIFKINFLYILILLICELNGQTWIGGDNSWSNRNFWIGGLPSNDGTANVIFNATDAMLGASLDSNWNIGTLTYQGTMTYGVPMYISGSGTLTIQNGVNCSANLASNQQAIGPLATFGMKLVLPTLQAWNVGSGSYLAVTGNIAGNGGIVKTGSGTLELSGGNTYSGGTNINEGYIIVSDDDAFGAGQVTLNGGGVLADNLSRNIVVSAAGGSIAASPNTSGNISSNISGNGMLVLKSYTNGGMSGGYITLSGNNTFTGGLKIESQNGYEVQVHAVGTSHSLGSGSVELGEGGRLIIDSESNIAAGNKILIKDKSVLVLGDASINPTNVVSSASSLGTLALGYDTTINTAIDLSTYGNGTLIFGAAMGKTVSYQASTMGVGVGNVYRLGGYSSGKFVISGYDNVLTGSASLLVSDGNIQLLNANNYTGGTTIQSGTLNIGQSGSLGTGVLHFEGGSLAPVSGTLTVTNNMILSQNKNFSYGDGLTLTGTLDLSGNTTGALTSNGMVIFANTIQNGVLKWGAGNAILEGNNTFSRLEIAGSAKVTISSASNLNSAGAAPIVFSSSSQDYAGSVEVINSVTLNNPVQFSDSSKYGGFKVSSGKVLTLNGSIGNGNLVKNGDGKMVLGSAVSYSGRLYIQQGTVSSSGTSLANVSVLMSAGANFIGTGKMNSLWLTGSNVTPNTGTGLIYATTFTSSTSSTSNLQFEFTQEGSPNYTNYLDAKNGLIAFNTLGSGGGGTLGKGDVYIYFSNEALQSGDVYRGAFFSNGSTLPSTALTYLNFIYYVQADDGTIVFDGKNFKLLDLSRYDISKSWVSEVANIGGEGNKSGYILEFDVLAIPEPSVYWLLFFGCTLLFGANKRRCFSR